MTGNHYRGINPNLESPERPEGNTAKRSREPFLPVKPGKPWSLEAGAGAEATEAAESQNPGNRAEDGGSGGGGCRSPWKERAGQAWRRLRRPTLLETGGAVKAAEAGRHSPLQERAHGGTGGGRKGEADERPRR